MEKITSGLLKNFVSDKVSAKMASDNIHVIKFIERQVAEFGVEKHTAFLERVFHGKKVSAEHFFKVLTRVEAAIAKKAGTKKVAKATKTSKPVAKATKTTKVLQPVAKATKTAITDVQKVLKQARKQNAQKESVSSVSQLKTDIAKLVKVYNEKADNGKKVRVTMSYIVAEIQ